jgi:hypothetical protein
MHEKIEENKNVEETRKSNAERKSIQNYVNTEVRIDAKKSNRLRKGSNRTSMQKE